MILPGLEPGIAGSVDRRLIHWATGPAASTDDADVRQRGTGGMAVSSPLRHYGVTFAELRWSSGYDARLTRERSPVQSWGEVLLISQNEFPPTVPQKKEKKIEIRSLLGLNQ